MTHGRGAVIIQVKARMANWIFHPGGPCGCFADAVATYDPEQQVVIGVVRDGKKAVYVIDDRPTPPEAFITAPAQVVGATLH